MTLTERLAVALLEQYGLEAVCRLLDDAENGDLPRDPGPAEVQVEHRRRALAQLGEMKRNWRPLVHPGDVCRPGVA